MTDLQALDQYVVTTVVGALSDAARVAGLKIEWIDTAGTNSAQTIHPGRNFYVQTNKGGVHWTVWLTDQNPLLAEDALREEVNRALANLGADTNR